MLLCKGNLALYDSYKNIGYWLLNTIGVWFKVFSGWAWLTDISQQASKLANKLQIERENDDFVIIEGQCFAGGSWT